MIHIAAPQGSQEWLDGRAGAITASRFKDAISRVGGLDEKQSAYLTALQQGLDKKNAAALAGYKGVPTGSWVERALSGERMDTPSAVALDYAWLIAMERIAGRPLDETFVTWQMRRGQDEEPNARLAYEIAQARIAVEAGVVLTDDRLFGYSTDGLVNEDPDGPGMIEIKVPSAPSRIALAWTDPKALLADYIDQIDGGLWITGRLWCDLCVYTPWLTSVGKKLKVLRVYRDEARLEQLETNLLEFSQLMRAFEARLRSPVDATPDQLAPATDVPTTVVSYLATSLAPSSPLVGDILPADLF